MVLFFCYLAGRVGISRLPKCKKNKVDYFVYAGSINQMNSLDSTIEALCRQKEHVVAIAPKKFINSLDRQSRYSSYRFGLFGLFKTLILVCFRVPGLYKTLKRRHDNRAISWYFNEFCKSYAYLVYFYDVFNVLKPDFVITANDHNVPNRCMMAVAHMLSIKTVYMQHASVSTLFPALRVDYAFLDGQSALDTYRLCEPNKAELGLAPLPKVFLSGQKKALKLTSKDVGRCIGVAINALDNVEDVLDLVFQLSQVGRTIQFRWHPGQPLSHVVRYKAALSSVPNVNISDPNEETIVSFLGKIGDLVAGNSSIHLEASTVGIMCYFFEPTCSDSRDYYGYVKNGLVVAAESVEHLIYLLRTGDSKKPDVASVQYYSATYQTLWDGREGELVAQSLTRIKNGDDLSNIFGHSPFFRSGIDS